MSQPKLIVLDDEVDFAEFVGIVATKAMFEVEEFNNANVFMQDYKQDADVIILDLMMPGVDGIEIIRFLAETNCDAHLILMSGFDSGVLHSAEKLTTEQGLNLAGSLTKPISPSKLNQLLSELIITPKNQNAKIPIEPPSLDELRNAFKNNELVVFYQPKVSLNNDSHASAEALVRWQHPERGLVPPNLFIPLAEDNDLIDELTWIVLEQSMNHCKEWSSRGLDVDISINMSANTLKELDLPEKMDRLIKKHDLKPTQIILEITESALMQELIKSLDILTRLRMKGFQLSIDDFGTGYSSLVQLYRAPFSEIKIDQSFVSVMEHDTEAATIVETTIMLGRKLNMKTIAEGVETESCRKILQKLGCDQAQGYLFARPMPAEEVFPWFSGYFQR